MNNPNSSKSISKVKKMVFVFSYYPKFTCFTLLWTYNDGPHYIPDFYCDLQNFSENLTHFILGKFNIVS